MTTVAYRAGVMAADTQCSSGNRKFRISKIKRLKCGGLLGGSGSLAALLKIQRWAEGGFKADEAPEFGDDGGDFEALIVKGDGTVYLLDDEMELMPVSDEFIAVGSGGTYAMAAMHCGLSPVEAVKVAACYDPSTGEPVHEARVEPVKPKVKARVRK